MSRRRKRRDGSRRFHLWIPFVLALAAYAPAIGHGFVWDDASFIRDNPAAHDLSRLATSLGHGYGWVPGGDGGVDAYLYFRPVIVIANTLHWILSGGSPVLFHLANVVTHGLNAALVSLLAVLLGSSPAVALLLGGIFALHPLHVEAVTWISGRTDLTATAFTLATLCLLLAWKQRPERRSLSVAATLTFLLALLSKESAAVLVVLAPLLVLTPPRGGERGRAGVLAMLGAALVVYLLLRIQVMGPALVGSGADNLPARGPLPARAILAGCLFLLYLLRFVVPWPLSVEPPAALAEPPYPIGIGVAGLLALAAAAFFGWRAIRRGGAAGVAWGLAGLGILPVLQFIPTGEVYGERFVYLPAAGLLILAGLLLERRGVMRPRAAHLTLVLLALPCLLLLESRVGDWRDEVSLFRRAAATHPHSARAHANLGSALMDLGQLPEAERSLAEAVRLDPDDPRKQAQYGSLLVNMGRVDEGVAKLEGARARMTPTRTLLKNLGVGWTHQGRYEEATVVLERALAIDPDSPDLLEALGTAERKRERYDVADRLYRRAVELEPDRPSVYLNLIGLHFFNRRDPETGRQWARRFLERFPHAPQAAQTRQLLRGETG